MRFFFWLGWFVGLFGLVINVCWSFDFVLSFGMWGYKGFCSVGVEWSRGSVFGICWEGRRRCRF